MDLNELFDAIWVNLALKGKCDAIGSAEYQRVRREWVAYHRFVLVNFMLEAANRPPSDSPIPTDAMRKLQEGVDLAEIGRIIGELPRGSR